MERAKEALFQEDEYLEELISEESIVRVYLLNGVCLTGQIIDFGASSILISNTGKKMGGANQLIYKHAITSIAKNFDMQGNYGWDDE